MGSAKNNPFLAKQLQEYGAEGIKYYTASLLIKKYVQAKGVASENSAATYRGKLWRFAYFVHSHYDKKPFDDFITKQVKAKGKPDPYDLLTEFAAYLKAEGTKPNEIRAKVKRVYKFLRSWGIAINNEDFRDRVTLPRQEFPDFEGADYRAFAKLRRAAKAKDRHNSDGRDRLQSDRSLCGS